MDFWAILNITFEVGEATVSYLNGRFVEVTQVGGGLTRLLTQDHHVRVDQTKGVDHNFTYTKKKRKNSKR